MTAMLCVDEPFASAMFITSPDGMPLKRWETRSCPPNGDMRPDGVRGFPGVRVNRGDRIIIAATARTFGFDSPTAERVRSLPLTHWIALQSAVASDPERSANYPLGHILGTVAVTNAVPIIEVDADVDIPWRPHVAPMLSRPGELFWWKGEEQYGRLPGWKVEPITDQLPWGLWDPGRWAWKLSDPISTTEQCPGPECRHGSIPARDPLYPDMTAFGVPLDPCPICAGEGNCPPVPVTGHQGLRRWNGEVRGG